MIFISCSIIPKPETAQKEILLLEHAQSLKNFRIDGLIELNYKALRFRKNITIRKDDNSVKFDIYDTGIMGMSATPFLSVSIDSLMNVVQTGELNLPNINEIKLLNFSDLFNIMKHKREILENGSYISKNFTIKFRDDMKIKSIEFDKYFIRLEYINELKLITLRKKDEKIAMIQIDKISSGNVDLNQ